MNRRFSYLFLTTLIIHLILIDDPLIAHGYYPYHNIEESEEETVEDLADRLTYDLWRIVLHKNKKKLEKVISDDFKGEAAVYQFDKAALCHEVFKGDFDQISIKEIRAEMNGKRLIISYYIETNSELPSGQAYTKWRSEGGQWKLVFLRYEPEVGEEQIDIF